MREGAVEQKRLFRPKFVPQGLRVFFLCVFIWCSPQLVYSQLRDTGPIHATPRARGS
jgi:hypothetical protein